MPAYSACVAVFLARIFVCAETHSVSVAMCLVAGNTSFAVRDTSALSYPRMQTSTHRSQALRLVREEKCSKAESKDNKRDYKKSLEKNPKEVEV